MNSPSESAAIQKQEQISLTSATRNEQPNFSKLSGTFRNKEHYMWIGYASS